MNGLARRGLAGLGRRASSSSATGSKGPAPEFSEAEKAAIVDRRKDSFVQSQMFQSGRTPPDITDADRQRIAQSHRFGHYFLSGAVLLTIAICCGVYLNEESNREVRRRGVEAEKAKQQDAIRRLIELRDTQE